MTKIGWFSAVVFAALFLAPAACSVGPKGYVTFVIPIRKDWFSQEAILHVNVLNAEKLATQTSGVQGSSAAVAAEEFNYPIGQVVETVEAQSKTVRAGERFALIFDGLSPDGCSTTSAQVEWVADAEMVYIKPEDLQWHSEIGSCAPAP